MKQPPLALPFNLRIVRERWYHKLLDRLRLPQTPDGKVVAQVQFDCTVHEGSDGSYRLRPQSPESLDRLAAKLEALRVKKAAQPEPLFSQANPDAQQPPDTLDEPNGAKDLYGAEAEGDRIKDNTPRPLAVYGYNRLTRDVLLVDLRGQLYQCALPKVRAWETPPRNGATARKKPDASTPNESNST